MTDEYKDVDFTVSNSMMEDATGDWDNHLENELKEAILVLTSGGSSSEEVLYAAQLVVMVRHRTSDLLKNVNELVDNRAYSLWRANALLQKFWLELPGTLMPEEFPEASLALDVSYSGAVWNFQMELARGIDKVMSKYPAFLDHMKKKTDISEEKDLKAYIIDAMSRDGVSIA